MISGDNNTLLAHSIKKIITLAGLSGLAFSPALMAQNQEASLEEQMMVVGSRTPGRSADDLPVPVDILDADTLSKTGQTEVGRMLQQAAPSFNFSSSSISDGTDALRPATLRGLGPDQTLVLINGKRRHQASLIHINTSVGRGTAGTDMNAIPAASIKRIEILRDGAAAQYGSDAIAGIINIVLKDSADGGHVSASYGQFSEGDGQQLNMDLNKGFGFADSGFVNLTANYRDRGNTNRAAPQGGCLYGGCTDTDGNGFLEPAPGNGTLEVEGKARDGFRIGDADSTQLGLVLNAGMTVGRGELYSFITYSTRENESGAFHRNPTGTNGVDDALLTDGLNPADPQGFLPIIYSEIDDLSYNIGYQQDFNNNGLLDISYTAGTNTIDYSTRNSANYSYANHLQFGEGLSDAHIREQIPRDANAYGLELGLQTFNANFSQHIGRVNYSIGGELRNDHYKIIAGEEYAYRDYDTDPFTGDDLYSQNAGGSIQGFNGIGPESSVDEERSVTSAYADAEYQATHAWLLSGAARFDQYEGFGNTVNYKMASSYQVAEPLKLRGSVSTGFRAPSMQQLYFNNISTQIRDEGAVTVGTFRNDSPVVRALGVPELKEEESTNISVGFVANLSHNWNVTADYYSIDITDRIALSNQLTASDDPGNGELTEALDAVGAAAAQFFLNGADTETSGVDIVSTYSGIALGEGELNLTLAANFTETKVTSTYVPDNGALSTVDPSSVFSDQDISIIEQWQPKDRIVLSGDYHLDAFTAKLAFNRYGEYTVLDSTEQTYGAEWLTDIRLNYQLGSGVNIFIVGNNIFNVTPDEATNTTSRGGNFESSAGAEDMASNSVFQFSRRSAPFGFNGAFYSAGVSFKF